MTTNNPTLAQDLLRIHKVITRGLEVGLKKGKDYLISGFSSPEELRGYSSYIHSFASVLDSHHSGEDLFAFPALRKVLPLAPYSQLATDHRSVEMLLARLPKPITDLSGNQPGEGLNVITDTLAKISEVWYPHIHLEEANFAEEKLNAVLTIDEQKNISAATAKYSQEHSDPPYWVIPFVLFNLDRDERAKMAVNIPPKVMNELVPIVWKDQWSPMKPFLLE